MSLDKKHQHWLDADDNEVYASELRTAAAVYIFGLETALAAATQRAEKAEAELEALKARRCGGCKHWHGHNYCAEGIAEECDVPELPDHDFACNRWTPKEADHEA